MWESFKARFGTCNKNLLNVISWCWHDQAVQTDSLTLNKNIIICISIAISLATIDTITGDINALISNRPIVKKLNIAAVFGNF